MPRLKPRARVKQDVALPLWRVKLKTLQTVRPIHAIIAKEIEAVQAISGEISENMEQMINSISDLSASTDSVATAIEQQNIVVSDIANQMEDLTTLAHAKYPDIDKSACP